MAIVKGSFYHPRPSFGVKFSDQVDELRENSDNVYPLVVASDQDYDSATGNRVLNALRFGDLTNDSKFRVVYDTSSSLFKLQVNTGSASSPTWTDVLTLGSDASVTVGSGGLYNTGDYYNISFPANPTVTGVDSGSNNTSFSNVNNITFDTSGFYLGPDGSGEPTVFAKASSVVGFVSGQFNSSQTWTVNHNLNTEDVIVQVYDENKISVIPDSITINSVNQLTVSFYANQSGKVVVLGKV